MSEPSRVDYQGRHYRELAHIALVLPSQKSQQNSGFFRFSGGPKGAENGSEIRLGVLRQREGLAGDVVEPAVGADAFFPRADRASESDRGRPGLGEHAGILDAELNLQP